MKAFITLLFLVVSNYCFGQHSHIYQEAFSYLKLEVDSILLLSTNHTNELTSLHDFPLENYDKYLSLYEVKKLFSNVDQLQKLIDLFPSVKCNSFPVSKYLPK